MDPREELDALRRMAELEAKAGATQPEHGSPEARHALWEEFKTKSGQARTDKIAGLVRGAGSIGATLLWPYDAAKDAITGDADRKVSDLVTGRKPKTSNELRREGMDQGLRELGADTSSTLFQAGKLGGEVAGTAGVGGLLGNAARGVGNVLGRLGIGGVSPEIVTALTTGGMRTGAAPANLIGAGKDLALRAGAGAVVGGASAGLIDPGQAGVGALVGGGLPIVAKVAGGAGNMIGGALRGVAEPFTPRGPLAIAGRTLDRFGVTPNDVRGLSGGATVTGARPSLAERIQRPEGAAGAARLQDSLRSIPELAPRMAAREVENNAARVGTLETLAGSGGARDFAVAERSGTAGPMYQEAFSARADAAPAAERELRALMRAPAIRAAQKAAQTNAANAGANVGASNASGSVEGLHQMKLALDDMISKAEAKTTGAAANEAHGLREAQKRLVSYIESISPEYVNARGTYAQMSRPVNQMDIAGEVLRSSSAPTTDLSGTARLMPGNMGRVLGDEAGLVRKATGRNLGSLDKVLDPEQLSALRAVADEVDRLAAVTREGNGPGSATAQRLASTNLLRQVGLPAGVTENAFTQTLARPIQFAARLAEPRLQKALLEVVHNPALAEEAMRLATPAQRVQLQRIMDAARLAAPPLAADR